MKFMLRQWGRTFLAPLSFLALAVPVSSQAETISGWISSRSAEVVYVNSEADSGVKVVLSTQTLVQEKDGLLGWGHKSFAITELVPGLSVKVAGVYDDDHEFLATKILFARKSLNQAHAINAGVTPVSQQASANQEQLKADRADIESSQQSIAVNAQDINTNKQAVATANQAAAQNTAAIGAVNQRLDHMDDFTTKDSLTITFANGKAVIIPSEKEALSDFVRSCANTPGYMIEVQGYASAVGSTGENQKLSQARAEAVVALIQQTGAIPLTRILAPAAMGITNQVAGNQTLKGQAQNRRVVVSILLNKGIAAPAGQQS